MGRLQGQNLRVFVNGKCIAVATSCSFHIGLQLEEDTDKDAAGLYQHQSVVAKNWDVSCEAFYDPEAATESNAITSAELARKIITEENPELELKWDATTGEKNRTGKGVGYQGMAIYNDFSSTASVKQKVSASHQFTGNGPLTEIQ